MTAPSSRAVSAAVTTLLSVKDHKVVADIQILAIVPLHHSQTKAPSVHQFNRLRTNSVITFYACVFDNMTDMIDDLEKHQAISACLLGEAATQDDEAGNHEAIEPWPLSLRQKSQRRHAQLLSSTIKYILLGLAMALSTVGIWTIAHILRAHWPSHHPICYCGESDQEAIDMGCKFDHLAVDWLPTSCIDHELTQLFIHSGPNANGTWPFYSDWNDPTSLLTLSAMEQLATSGKDYYAIKGWHVAHCMFTLRKQFRAPKSGITLEPWNNNEEHVVHCLEYVMDTSIKYNEIETKIPGWDRHGRKHRWN